MYRIRFNKNSFRDPHYVTTVEKWSDDTVKSISISSLNWWESKHLKTAQRMMARIDTFAVSQGKDAGLYEIEEFSYLDSHIFIKKKP